MRSNARHHAAAEHGPRGNPSSKVTLPSSLCLASGEGSGAGARAAGAGVTDGRGAAIQTESGEDEGDDIKFSLNI